MGSTRSVFDEGFESGEGFVPLGGDAVEVAAELVDGLQVELVEAVAAGADAADDVGALEDAEVFSDSLAGEMGAVGQLRDGMRLAPAELGEQREAGGIAERGKGAGRTGTRPSALLLGSAVGGGTLSAGAFRGSSRHTPRCF